MHPVRPLALTVLLVVAFGVGGQAEAGGGPENVLLVVNANSDASKTIANHYIRLRDIPPINVAYLDWKGSTTEIVSDVFREEILKPVLEEIDDRKLAAQIDYIVYSSDFPYRVRFTGEFKDEDLPKQFRPIASLTGATYLWQYSLNKVPALVMPTVNWYVTPAARKNQASCTTCDSTPTRGFRSRPYWKADGSRTSEPTEGQTYFLSTMLGVTVNRGNTVDEVIGYLTKASLADAAAPRGTFYFMENSNIRSKTRDACYRGVGQQLQALGARVAILDGTVPTSAKSALGIMAGTAKFSLDTNEVSIAPGAICENLTSLGGAFDATFQTKLSAWLRAGAAGSSGTVTEPYAIQSKFPLPSIHLHYRRGASLAEAFYQSVSGPYQLLVVGDPLCQPWAKPPAVVLEGLEPGAPVVGKVNLKAQVTPAPGTEVKECELFVDGRLLARYPVQLTVPLDTSQLAPGRHELRAVVSTTDALEFRGRAVTSIEVVRDAPDAADSPAAPTVSIEVSPTPIVPAGSRIAVTVAGPPETRAIDILQNHRRVGRVEGASGTVEVDSSLLGRGPVALVAQLCTADQGEPPPPNKASRSAPVWLLIR